MEHHDTWSPGHILERGPVPLYVQLTRILRSKINSGELKPGDGLPPEGEISKTFAVSRITVREALRILTDEGLVVRQSGKGTFVAPPPPLDSPLWVSCSFEDLIWTGETHRKILGYGFCPAARSVSERLLLVKGERIFQVRALMYAHGTPYSYITLSIPQHLARQLPKERLAGGPLIQLLMEDCGVRVGQVDQWTTADLADKEIATLLEIKRGEAILVIEKIFHDPEGQPVEMAIHKYRTDVFRHHIRYRQQRLLRSEGRRGTIQGPA